jgi:hypothetical protein
MTAVPIVSPEKTPIKNLSSCPYLGMQSDPETHVGVPDSRNCCFLFDPSAIVNLSHQDKYCLNSSFQGCDVYIHSGEIPWPAEIFETESNGKQSFTWPMLPLARSRKKAKKEVSVEAAQEKAPTQGLAQSLEPNIQAESPDTAWPYHFNRLGSKTWLFIAIPLSLLIIVIAAWSSYLGFHASRIDSEQLAKNAFTGGLVTAVQGIGVVSSDWGAAIILMESPTWTPRMNLSTDTGMLSLPALLATETPSPVMTTPTPAGAASICQDIASTNFQIISGPYFDPKVGGISRWHKVPPVARAEWQVKNTGSCIWTQIYFWSTSTNQVISPIIQRGSDILDPDNLQGIPIAVPGEEITIALEFQVDKGSNFSVKDEWYLVVNGISLPEQPRFSINADTWITILKPQPTTKITFPAGGGGRSPTPVPPPSRPMPMP